MSAKSAIKTVASEGQLFRWVAILTGSKNALKGVGFFLGGVLLTTIGFNLAVVGSDRIDHARLFAESAEQGGTDEGMASAIFRFHGFT